MPVGAIIAVVWSCVEDDLFDIAGLAFTRPTVVKPEAAAFEHNEATARYVSSHAWTGAAFAFDRREVKER